MVYVKPGYKERFELGDTPFGCLIFAMEEITGAVGCGLIDNHCQRGKQNTRTGRTEYIFRRFPIGLSPYPHFGAVISPDSEEYQLRFWPRSDRLYIRKTPAVAIIPGLRRKELQFIGSTDPSAYPEICCYLSRPDSAEDGFLRIPRSLRARVEEEAARMVKAVLE